MSLDGLLDFVLGGRRTVRNNLPSVDDTRLLSLTDDNSLTFQAPDMSAQAQHAARVTSRLGGNAPDLARNLTTRKSTLNLGDNLQRKADGTLEIDFTQFGGQQFKGTLEELSKLQGTALLDVIGAGAVDTASGNTLPNNVVQGAKLVEGNGVTRVSPTNTVPEKIPYKPASTVNGETAATTTPTSFIELSDIDDNFDSDLAARLDDLLPDSDRDSLLDTILKRAQGAVNDARRGS